MSLPLHFDPELSSLKDTSPYIKPIKGGKSLVKKAAKKLNIGLAWGTDQYDHTGQNHKVPLHALAPLFELPGITWHSLQTGPVADDLHNFLHRDKINPVGSQLKDFADTANAIAKLDLVISCDTAVAHLAGAMGKPLWVMLPKQTDWCWQSDDGVGRWYLTSRLYPQISHGDWKRAIDRLITELRLKVAK